VEYVLLAVKVGLSATIASKTANDYWAKSDNVHCDTSDQAFESWYRNIVGVLKPTKEDIILDAGCGAGQLTYLLRRDGFDTKGFDSSNHKISQARSRFGDGFYVDDLVWMRHKQESFTKIFLLGVFTYLHPANYKPVLKNLHDILSDHGVVYLLDDPDYCKRYEWNRKEAERLQVPQAEHVLNALTRFFPLWFAPAGAFWVKTCNIERAASHAGFSRVLKLDGWSDYRSHHVLFAT
jgi:SAM-dependent methyltransferase